MTPRGTKLSPEHRAKLSQHLRERWRRPGFAALQSVNHRAVSKASRRGETLADRLAARSMPEPNSGCQLWLGTYNTRGYGVMCWRKRNESAHRLSWEAAYGAPPPADKFVCHHCDVPACINPDHLFLGTLQDNNADKIAKGRQIRGEALSALLPKGEDCAHAKLTLENVLAIRRGGKSNAEWARLFNVSPSAIWHVRTKSTWRHV